MLKTLLSMQQNIEIRSKMQRQGMSFISNKEESFFSKIIKRFYSQSIAVGELNKSWDVFEAAEIIKRYFSPNDPILDMGAYGSEILLTLRAIGFKNLSGIDLNPKVLNMPFNNEIKYVTGDFYRTRYSDESFSAITSISAIEHGCDVKKLLIEVQRLLKPGGVFIASTDYWPQKINTDNIKMFNLDWTIFSQKEIEDLLDFAKSLKLELLDQCNFATEEKAISCAGKDYTFILFALKKDK